MKYLTITFLIILLMVSNHSCKESDGPIVIDEDTWKLGWRMIENSWDENLDLAESQFDSLLSLNKPIGATFLMYGSRVKLKLSKEGEVLRILEDQSSEIQSIMCEQDALKTFKPCSGLPSENIENISLQLEIINMFLDDQAIRGNLMLDLISKYDIDTNNIIVRGEIKVDDNNRAWVKDMFWNYGFSDDELEIINEYIDSQPDAGNTMADLIGKHNLVASSFISPSMGVTDYNNKERLKEIFSEYGFPTRKLIGKDAMDGVFYIIQHADADKEWQKLQLPYLELGAQSGDFSKSNYAYLYDRIQVNFGQKQRYGSQFSDVDRNNNIAELQEVEDPSNLNNRRREMDMMPIELYKKVMLRN